MKRLLSVVLVGAFVPAIAAAEEVPLEEWVRKPGVRLLAVLSVPHKCESCREEAARWQALAERHRARGLRVLAVVARDPMFGCVDPGWKPDGILCDAMYDGIAKRWRLPEKSSSAFLWSWKGELLVEHGDRAAIERMIARHLASTPQLVIDVREGDREGLLREVREAIAATNKYAPASPGVQSARRARLEKGSYAASYLTLRKCEPGRGLSGDALLGVRRTPEALQLTLRSEEGCRIESAAAKSVESAVADLFARIPRRVQALSEDRATVAEGELVPLGDTPEGLRERSRANLQRLKHPAGRQLARVLEKYLGRADLNGAALARAAMREAFDVEIGEVLREQLASGPEVPLDLRDPQRTLAPGDLIFYVSYGYVPKVVVIYLGEGLIAQAADIRGVVVEPVPLELPYFFQPVARRPLTGRP